MFWRKKKGKADKLCFSLEIEQDRRSAYRVTPRPDEPLSVEAGGRRFPVVDISAGGVAFRAAGARVGQRFKVRLSLPDGKPPLVAPLEVVNALKNHVAACTFHDLDEDSEERIHQYVLRRQKEELERQRLERLREMDEQG